MKRGTGYCGKNSHLLPTHSFFHEMFFRNRHQDGEEQNGVNRSAAFSERRPPLATRPLPVTTGRGEGKKKTKAKRDATRRR
jgi:hypothetical protein